MVEFKRIQIWNEAIEAAARAIEAKHEHNLGWIHPDTVSDAKTIRALKDLR